MPHALKIFLTIFFVVIFSAILAFVLAPVGGALHNMLWEYGGCGFWLPCDKGSKTEGFLYLFIFFSSVFSFSLLAKKTAWWTAILSALMPLAAILLIIVTEGIKSRQAENIGTFLLMLIAFGLGYLISLGAKKLKKS